MGLLDTAKEGRNTRNGNDRSTSVFPLLFGHLIGDGPRDKERSVKVDLLRLEEELVWHIQESMEWADSSVRDEHVDSAIFLDGLLHDLRSVERQTFQLECTAQAFPFQ